VSSLRTLSGRDRLFVHDQWLRFACHWLPSDAPAALTARRLLPHSEPDMFLRRALLAVDAFVRFVVEVLFKFDK
jgi:hypothetical protein